MARDIILQSKPEPKVVVYPIHPKVTYAKFDSSSNARIESVCEDEINMSDYRPLLENERVQKDDLFYTIKKGKGKKRYFHTTASEGRTADLPNFYFRKIEPIGFHN